MPWYAVCSTGAPQREWMTSEISSTSFQVQVCSQPGTGANAEVVSSMSGLKATLYAQTLRCQWGISPPNSLETSKGGFTDAYLKCQSVTSTLSLQVNKVK